MRARIGIGGRWWIVFRTRMRRESRSGGAPSLRAAFGVLVKCASAVPRSVQAGGWSPFRDVYGCVVAKWLYAVATREIESRYSPLLSWCRVEDLGSSASPASLYRPN